MPLSRCMPIQLQSIFAYDKVHTSEKQVSPLAKNKAKPKQSEQNVLEDEISAEDLALISAAFSTLAQAFTFLSLLKIREDTQQVESQEGWDGLEINLPPFRGNRKQ